MKNDRIPQVVLILTICRWLRLVAILACAAPAVATADSGVDSAIGNQLNRSSSNPVEQLATFKDTLSRSPTGLLYPSPAEVEAAQADTWTGTIEFGALFNNGDDGASHRVD